MVSPGGCDLGSKLVHLHETIMVVHVARQQLGNELERLRKRPRCTWRPPKSGVVAKCLTDIRAFVAANHYGLCLYGQDKTAMDVCKELLPSLALVVGKPIGVGDGEALSNSRAQAVISSSAGALGKASRELSMASMGSTRRRGCP